MNKKKIIIIAVVVVVALLVVLAVGKGKKTGGIKVTAEPAGRHTIIETVAANGKIQPELDVKISPYISGEVMELFVKEGDEVKKGDLLARIDAEIYIVNYERLEAALNSQKANEANSRARMAQTKAQFVNAELSYERNKKLWEQSVISKAEYDAALASFEVARAEVEAARQSVKSAEYSVKSAEASLQEAKENLTKTTIRAPGDGTVSKLSVEVGERVTGASQFSSGTEIMRLANLDEMEVNVEVNENDIVRVSLGDTCIIEVDAYLEEKFKGIVTEMATAANVTGVSADQVTNFEVKIRILRESYADMITGNSPIKSPFRPGMSATVDIQTEKVYDVLTVPIQAVTTRPDTATHEEDGSSAGSMDDEFKEYVFLYEEDAVRQQEVSTGIQDNTYIQILEGLEEGQDVVTGPYRAVSKKLKDGDSVQKVDKKDLFSDDK